MYLSKVKSNNIKQTSSSSFSAVSGTIWSRETKSLSWNKHKMCQRVKRKADNHKTSTNMSLSITSKISRKLTSFVRSSDNFCLLLSLRLCWSSRSLVCWDLRIYKYKKYILGSSARLRRLTTTVWRFKNGKKEVMIVRLVIHDQGWRIRRMRAK